MAIIDNRFAKPSRREFLEVALMGTTFPLVAGTAFAQSQAGEADKTLADIRVTVGDRIFAATLLDNPTARDVLKLLPLTISMKRYDDREYFGKPDGDISREGRVQDHFADGDLVFWLPRRTFVVFFDKGGSSNLEGVVVIGKLTSDYAILKSLGPSIEMKVEHVAS